MFQSQNRFDKTCQSRSSLGMAHVWLDLRSIGLDRIK